MQKSDHNDGPYNVSQARRERLKSGQKAWKTETVKWLGRSGVEEFLELRT